MHPKHCQSTTTNYNYTVTFSNCENPRCEMRFEGVSKPLAANLVAIGLSAFRDIQVVNNDTGEIVYNRYTSDEWFEASKTVARVVDELYTTYHRGA